MATKSLKALVDTGASHIFMAEDIMEKIGLHIAKKAGFIKAVNSKEMSILGMAEATEMRIGQWKEKVKDWRSGRVW